MILIVADTLVRFVGIIWCRFGEVLWFGSWRKKEKFVQKTIPRFKLNTTSTGPKKKPLSQVQKIRPVKAKHQKPALPTPAGSIAGGLVGGLAALMIAGGLLYVFCFKRKPSNVSEMPLSND